MCTCWWPVKAPALPPLLRPRSLRVPRSSTPMAHAQGRPGRKHRRSSAEPLLATTATSCFLHCCRQERGPSRGCQAGCRRRSATSPKWMPPTPSSAPSTRVMPLPPCKAPMPSRSSPCAAPALTPLRPPVALRSGNRSRCGRLWQERLRGPSKSPRATAPSSRPPRSSSPVAVPWARREVQRKSSAPGRQAGRRHRCQPCGGGCGLRPQRPASGSDRQDRGRPSCTSLQASRVLSSTWRA